MNAFDEIDELAIALNALRPLKLEYQQRLDKKFRLEFNYNSNHLEGNTLTYSETELLLFFDDTKGSHTMREYEEMKAHDAAYHFIELLAKDKEHMLMEKDIKELNQMILVRPFWKEALTPDGQSTRRLIKVGDYKEQPNSVRLQNGEMFNYASPTDTPIQMQELIDWYRENEETLYPVELAAMLHYKFVCIHPFDDGNGRISRLLMNYVLLKNDLPPIIIKSDDKKNYLRTLHLADVGDLKPFIAYIAEQLKWSLEISLKAAKGEDLVEAKDWEKELSIFKNKLGQNKDLKIELKYSPSNIQAIFNSTIKTFVKEWENQLERFDSLFYYRKCVLTIKTLSENNTFNLESNSLESELNNMWEEALLDDTEPIKSVKIFCSYEKLRVTAKEEKFWAGTLEFQFHDNAYEISFQDILPKKSLLYNEGLSSVEMENITNIFSTNLISYIKAATDK